MKCPKCNATVPDAKFCGSCGAPAPVVKATGLSGKQVGCGCLGLLAIPIFIAMLTPSSKTDEKLGETDRSIDAMLMCQEFVGRKLKAPGSAEFSSHSQTSIKKNSETQYGVIGWVDAQNSFGAKLRNSYVCVVEYQGGEKWTAKTVELVPR